MGEFKLIQAEFQRPPYKCHVCGKEFLDLDKYRKHVVKEHLNGDS